MIKQEYFDVSHSDNSPHLIKINNIQTVGLCIEGGFKKPQHAKNIDIGCMFCGETNILLGQIGGLIYSKDTPRAKQ